MRTAMGNSKSGSNGSIKWLVVAIIVIIIIGAAAAVWFFVIRGNNTDDAAIIERTSKHLILPAGEQPAITTVENAAEMSGQPFFANVKDGDKIMIYAQSARIIIYRPSENILVNVGPIVDDSAAAIETDATTGSDVTAD